MAESASHNGQYWSEKGQFQAQCLNYAEALNCFRQGLQVAPNTPEIWLLYGSVLEKLGCYGEAIAANSNAQKLYANPFLKQTPPVLENNAAVIAAITKHCSTADYHLRRGHALCDVGQYNDALTSYDQALALKPKEQPAWFNRGNVLVILGQVEAAIASYDRATQLQPSDHQAWNNRGYALHRLGAYQEAIASYVKALEAKPDCYPAWNNHGYALYHLGRLKEAVASYDKALTLQPNYPEAWNNRGRALKELGLLQEAIDSYGKALALKPDFDEAETNRALAQQALNEQPQDNRVYDTVLDLNLDYLEAWFHKANSLVYLGRYEEAIASYNKVLAYQSAHRDLTKDHPVAKQVCHLAAAYAHAMTVFQDSVLAWDWLKRPNGSLHETPLDLLKSDEGAVQVERMLNRMERKAG
ncbi:MAG: tetratricopeptide repeat protein [Thermosynechococcaceae cyanobacterium]